MFHILKRLFGGAEVAVEETPPEPTGPMSPEEVAMVEAERSAQGMKVYDWQLGCIANEMWGLLRKGKCSYRKSAIAFDAKHFFFWKFHDIRQVAAVCDKAAKEAGWGGATVCPPGFAPSSPTLLLWRPGTEGAMSA